MIFESEYPFKCVIQCLLDRLGRECLREREYGPTPWLTTQQHDETRRDRTTLRYVSCYSGISRHGPLPLLPLLYRRDMALRPTHSSMRDYMEEAPELNIE